VLTAGEHMLGQKVVCPECNESFLLRREDSLEHRKKQEQARRAAEERMARLWLSRAILAAAFIVASLVGMIAFSFALRPSRSPPAEPPSVPAPAARTD
jgi:anti-sigma-K factor RskA